MVNERGQWTMEDYLHFTETFSQYIFRKAALLPLTREMWGLPQHAVTYYFRACDMGQGRHAWSQAASDAAHQALLDFAKLTEEARSSLPECSPAQAHACQQLLGDVPCTSLMPFGQVCSKSTASACKMQL